MILISQDERFVMQPDFKIENKPIIEGRQEAESFLYRKYVDDVGRTWLVKDGRFAGDHIYVGKEVKNKVWFGRTLGNSLPANRVKYSNVMGGYEGNILEFELTNGLKIKLEGPFLTNSGALYQNCGVDVRDRHKTFVVVAARREIKDGITTLRDVVYCDPFVMESKLDRGEVLAKAFARSLSKDVWLYKELEGKTELKIVRNI